MDSFLKSFDGPLVPEIKALKIKVISLVLLRRKRRLAGGNSRFVLSQGDRDFLADLPGYLGLEQ